MKLLELICILVILNIIFSFYSVAIFILCLMLDFILINRVSILILKLNWKVFLSFQPR